MRRNKREDTRDRKVAFKFDYEVAKGYELIAKVKFWFGQSEDIFKDGLVVELSRGGLFAYIYRKRAK